MTASRLMASTTFPADVACPFLPVVLCVLERWWLVHACELGSRKEERIEAAIPKTENGQREIVTGVRVLAARGSRNNSETSETKNDTIAQFAVGRELKHTKGGKEIKLGSIVCLLRG